MSPETLPPTLHRLRTDQPALTECLDNLDHNANDALGLAARRLERRSYRKRSLIVELDQPDVGWVRYRVPTRNISREGLGMLFGRYVYPATKCRIMLETRDAETTAVPGRIVHCRYLTGSAHLYDVGARFDRPLDLESYAARPIDRSFVMVSDGGAAYDFVRDTLASVSIELRRMGDLGEVIRKIPSSEYRAVLIDLDAPGLDAHGLAVVLRARGFRRELLALTSSASASIVEACLSSGYSQVLATPLTRNQIIDLAQAVRTEPPTSSLAHRADMAASINRFVLGLSSVANQMENAFDADNRDTLAALARKLRGTAAVYGFVSLARHAEALEKITAEDTERINVRNLLTPLTRACQAARPVARPTNTPIEQGSPQPPKPVVPRFT